MKKAMKKDLQMVCAAYPWIAFFHANDKETISLVAKYMRSLGWRIVCGKPKKETS